MNFSTLEELRKLSEESAVPMWKVVLSDDANERAVSEEDSFNNMLAMYEQMKLSDSEYDKNLVSPSGLSGGDGYRIEKYLCSENSLIGPFLSGVMARAVKMGESNACMKRIVTAPTAGSCGVIPAVLITYEQQKGVSQQEIVKALFLSAGIGEIIAKNACISGAQGGCQAEIGSACAMAAGALTFLEGGTDEQVLNSVALALKSLLGLTCDPVAGLVEVPCIKRNVLGAVNAVTACQMALAGVESKIPPDEVIDSMRRIGALLPTCLRETGEEGLAVTPTGKQIKENMRS